MHLCRAYGRGGDAANHRRPDIDHPGFKHAASGYHHNYD